MKIKIRKISYCLFAAIALSSCIVQAKGSDVTFPGGVINPTGSFIIPLNKLVSGISYNLICNFENKSEDKITFSIFPYYSWQYLDGKYFQNQTALPSGKHELKIEYVGRSDDYPTATIKITNADQDFPIIVEGCKATAR